MRAQVALGWLVWLVTGLGGCAQGGVCVQSSDCGPQQLCSNGSCRDENVGTPGWTESTNGPPSGGASSPALPRLQSTNDASHGNMVCLKSGVLDGAPLTGAEVNIVEMILPNPPYTAFSIMDPSDGTQLSVVTAGTLDVLPLTLARVLPDGVTAVSLGLSSAEPDPTVRLETFTLQQNGDATGQVDLHVGYSLQGRNGERVTKDLVAHLTLIPGSPTDTVMTYSPENGWPGADPTALSCTPPC